MDQQSNPTGQIMPVSEAGGTHMIGGIGDNNPALDQLLANLGDMDPEDAGLMLSVIAQNEQKRQDIFDALAHDVEAKLTKRMGTRKVKENQWLESLRIFLGSLSSFNVITGDYPFGTPDAPYGARQDNDATHRPEFNIIRQKCNIAVAQTIAYQFAAGDKNWNLRAPQIVDLDQQDMQVMMQQLGSNDITPDDAMLAKVDLMERQIEDHLEQTNYAQECRKALWDRAVLGTGVMKGPMNAGKLRKVYQKMQTSDGRMIRVPKLTVEKTPCVSRVNLWYFFPDDSVTEIERAEDAIECHPESKTELAELMQHPGFFSDQIALCLKEEPRSYTNSPFNDPAYLTQGINLLKNKYLVLEYHGPIKREDLDMLGKSTDMPEGVDDIYGEIWVCNSRVIRLELETLEGCNKLPYYACVWEGDPATVFGFGIPMLARDQQRVVNESYKMFLDNAGLSAGPQVVIDTTIIKAQEGGNDITPMKTWLGTEYGADLSKAIQFFVPPSQAEGLAMVIDRARSFADEESSINLITAGAQNPAGAMDNATGMALINENALTPLFFKAEEWDDHITRPLIESMYDWEMQYNDNDALKGTYTIDVRSSTAYLKSTMEQRNLDRLFQEIAQGSPIAEWVNMDELAQMRLATMKLPSKGIVKSAQQVAQDRAKAPPPQPDPAMLKAQAAMQANDLTKQQLDLDANKLQFDQQKHAETLQAQYQIQHDTNVSKIQEHVLDLHKATIEQGDTQDQRQFELQKQSNELSTNMTNTAQQERTKRMQTGVAHAQHLDNVSLQNKAIESQEKQSSEKAQVQLKSVRVNAEARKQSKPNRNITEHNPSPK